MFHDVGLQHQLEGLGCSLRGLAKRNITYIQTISTSTTKHNDLEAISVEALSIVEDDSCLDPLRSGHLCKVIRLLVHR